VTESKSLVDPLADAPGFPGGAAAGAFLPALLLGRS